jgi:hypothetical protein
VPDAALLQAYDREDSHGESLRLDGVHEQAVTRPLTHYKLVQLYGFAAKARLAADLVGQPAVVILDTLADLFPDNENDRAQARQFVGMLSAIAIKYKCAVILLAHPSPAGLNNGTGTSGSTGWNNSVRSRLYLTRVIQATNQNQTRIHRC